MIPYKLFKIFNRYPYFVSEFHIPTLNTTLISDIKLESKYLF